MDIKPIIDVREVFRDKCIADCLASIGYKKISTLQYRVFKKVLMGYTVIVIAPTGIGKTEAAVFPILYNISRKKIKPIGAIYVTPLRALNRDMEYRLRKIAQCFNLTVALRHGDTPQSLRRRIRENPPHLLITTPETFQYILADSRFRDYLVNVRYIVIDEYREIITSKRGIELLSAINILEKIIGRRIIKIGLTATLRRVYEALSLMDNLLYSDIVEASVGKGMELSIETPDEKYTALEYDVDPGFYSRLSRVKELINRYKYVLVFVNTRDLAERIGWGLSSILGFRDKVMVYHGSLSRQHRLRAERLFRDRKINTLIATSSLELGIDIGHVEYVVQYMSPRQAVRLIQRIGRSIHRIEGVPRGSVITLGNFFDVLESIVIGRRAFLGQLEDEDIPQKPLDVLAHQIVLRVLVEPGIKYDDLFLEFHTSRVFNELSEEEFKQVVDYLVLSRIIRVRNNRLFPSYRAKIYFYRTTMIPDTRSIAVIDVSTGKKIGVLNEEFIILNLEENSILVLGGGSWKVIGFDQDEGKLYVEPVEEITQIIIPRWEGESIPIQYKVAREMGAFVRLVIERDMDYAMHRLGYHNLKVSKGSKKIIDGLLNSAISTDTILPSDRNMVIEINSENKYIILYGFFGSKVSNTLKEIILALTRKHIFAHVSAYATPYYIIVSFENYRPKIDDAYEIIYRLKALGSNPKLFEKYVSKIIRESKTFLWRIFFVGQRFGAIDIRKKEKLSRSILKALADTVIGVEAYRETLLRDYDLVNTFHLLRGLYNGALKVYVFVDREYVYPLFKEAINRIPSSMELHVIDLETYKHRLLKKKVSLICMICSYKWSLRVEDVIKESYIECPKCSSRYVAVIKGNGVKEQEVVKKVLSKKRLRHDEKQIYRDLQKRGLLVMDFGSKAALILASRGVGFTEAVRIINKYRGDEKELIKLLYEAEKKFIRIKKYLDRPKV